MIIPLFAAGLIVSCPYEFIENITCLILYDDAGKDMVKKVIYEYFDSRSWMEILHVIKIKKTRIEDVQSNHQKRNLTNFTMDRKRLTEWYLSHYTSFVMFEKMKRPLINVT